MKAFFCFCAVILFVSVVSAQAVWESKLDGKIRFYQTTDFGVLLAATDESLYAVDGQTGKIVWRRKHKGLDETSISPIADTDLILLSIDEGNKSRIEAIDVFSGESLWRSEKVAGDVMQLAVEPGSRLLCAVLVKKAFGKSSENLRRKPSIIAFGLDTGDLLWKREIDSNVEMLPTSFSGEKDVSFTLDNFRPPMIIDGRVYLFYEGVTILDAANGKDVEREKFKVNEGGLALTEADPIFDDENVYLSGRGQIRAIDRRTGNTVWKAKDLGVTPEISLVNNTLYVRTGGQFTRLTDGETVEKGSFGISAIDTHTGRILWRWKGADKGLTNFVFTSDGKIAVADRDDLTLLNDDNGKRLKSIGHRVESARFLIKNEAGQLVVGGKDEIAGFNAEIKQALWRVKHRSPSRGMFRIIGAIALRATAIYFRYGGMATSIFNYSRNAVNLANTISSFRFSGLKTRYGSFDLTSLASNYSRGYVSNEIQLYGVASRVPDFNGLRIQRPNLTVKVAPARAEVQEKLLDRLDPAHQLEKLSNFLLKRKELAEMHGNFMYFYTDLGKPFDRKGLIGVNVQTGSDSRFILVDNPDPMFTIDETNSLLYSIDGIRLQAFDFMQN